MDKGIYCLVFKNHTCTCRVGSLGILTFRSGWHIYVGSALGPGGLARVRRHFRLAQTRDRRPVWHIDALLLSPNFHLAGCICGYTEKKLECALAEEIGGDAVAGFGCSDCRCLSHLFWRTADPTADIIAAFHRLGLQCQEHKTQINGSQA